MGHQETTEEGGSMDASQQKATEEIHGLTASELTDEGLDRVIALTKMMKRGRTLLAATGSRNPQTEAAVTEKTLRAEGRIHGSEAYEKLGLEVTEEIPAISPELAALCAAQPVKSMLVLDAGHSLIDLAKASEDGWGMFLGYAVTQSSLASAAHDTPAWVIVPMEVSTEPQTRRLPKTDAIRAVQDKNEDLTICTPDPRLMALGILLHERATGEELLQSVYTFTSESSVIVGYSDADGFCVDDDSYDVDDDGFYGVGLAPVGITKN